MKNNPLQKLKYALIKCQGMEAGIAADKIQLAACAAERTVLEGRLELTDEKALTRMAQLQVIAAIAPQRMETRLAGLENARNELVAMAHEFIRGQLRPRCLELRQSTESRLRKSLEGHFRNEADLATAVNVAEPMVVLERIQALAIIGGTRTEGCQEKALRLTRAWNELEEFEGSFQWN